MAAPSYANPNEHRAPMKSPSECGRNFAPLWGWKLGDTEALREERQLGRHAGYALRVDLLTNKALSWKLPGGSGQTLPTLRHAGGRDKLQSRPSPPGQPKVLVLFQGFSESLCEKPRIANRVPTHSHSRALAR